MSNFEKSKQIYIADYLSVLIKHKRTAITVFVLLTLLVASFYFFWSDLHQVEALLKIGQVDGGPIQDPKEALFFLKNHPEIKIIAQGINISTRVDGYLWVAVKTRSARQGQELLEKVSDILLEEHQRIFDYQQWLINQQKGRYEKELEAISVELTAKQKELARFSSVSNEGQGLALQGYLLSISAINVRKEALENSLRSLEQKQETNIMTQVQNQTEVFDLRESLIKIFGVAGFVGLAGGVITAFIKDWWQRNNQRLKNETKFKTF